MNQADERSIVVTGGGSGIGLAIAASFAQAGARVTLVGRHRDKLCRAAAELGDRVHWQVADVGKRADVSRAVQSIVAQQSGIDVLVNCAGFARYGTSELPLDEAEALWDEVVGANLKGSYLMALACAPHLPRPGGRIINISSVAAFLGGSRPGLLAYAAAKAGIHGLTLGLAREPSPHGITSNAVAPGLIVETDFFGPRGLSGEATQVAIAQTPAGRAGRPDDIAAAVRYLASPEASFVTGEILSVNGGWLFGR